MDYLQSFAVSAAGMGVERARVEAASMNLAHANTVQGPGAPAFQPLRVVARAGPAFGTLVADGAVGLGGPVAVVEQQHVLPRQVYEPGHPLADGRGFVAYAPVDPALEMVTLMSAMRSYEANVAAMNTARTLALKTLDIGRGA